ncbi:MAG: hypothetical protein Q4G22_15360 [Paracoccus sp. (in: a-proteobacteria)]|uniref:hypothetical protein n=1 Tax=Paracoccus sp. TaxID=267 RepID=UPI0026DF57CF|nr:hypothetical protein [Paracoccus sp. (in: a-proteobacteria)]MDO5633191.1 hypothetical protein [Paracoccus sp. (in: a-proteobacteria)]
MAFTTEEARSFLFFMPETIRADGVDFRKTDQIHPHLHRGVHGSPDITEEVMMAVYHHPEQGSAVRLLAFRADYWWVEQGRGTPRIKQ